ncbi:MAG: hypothetical protein U0T80_02825 [Flavobacteriaceae bacterium]
MMMKITKTRLIADKNSFVKFSALFTLLLVTMFSFGQTNPAAFNLSGGNFSFTTQTATNTTYPTNMQGWNNSGVNNLATLTTAASTADITMTASASASTAGLGNLGASGFQFLTTGTVQTVGAIAVSLNATGRKNLLATWTAADQTSGSTRQMNLTLQYRLGTTGSFTTVTGSTYTTSNNSQAAAQTFTNIALPSACDNQAVVQLRWIYYESATQSGSRDAIRLDDITVSSSSAAPTINGTIAANEYGTHTNGSNQQSSATGTWYMSSDATNLYIGISGTNTNEGAVLYLDKNPISPVNGGTNADGSLVGYNYDGSSFANLQFRADLVVYFKDGYQEYRTANGSGGWSTQTTTGMTYSSTFATREIAIPWSAIGGQPAAYNWFGYVAYTGGGAYASVPTENPGSGAGLVIGTSARWSRYYTVSTSSTLPFSRNSYTFTDASSATNFGSMSVWDFTMNSSGLFLSRTGNVTGNWTIGGNLTVGNGTIYLGNGGSGYGTTSIAGNLNLLGGTFDMDATTGAVSVTGNVSISSGATLKLSTAVGGDLNVAGNWTNSGTFTPSTRLVQFNGTTAQTLTGTTTFDYFKINNTNGLTLINPITVNTNLDLTLGKITLGTNNLTLGSAATATNASATSYVVTNSTGALVRNSVGNTATPFPVGLVASYTPLTVTNTGTSNNLSLVVTSPPSNAVSDDTKIVNLEWNLNSAGTGSVANITFNWNTPSNVGTSYSATGTGELGNYTTGPNYAITNIGTMAGVSKLVNGVALSSGSNKLVLGNTNAVYAVPPSNDNCSGATAITLDAAAITGNVTNATQSLPAITCTTTGTANDDVWYSFTTNGAGNYTVTVVGSASFDAVVDIRSGACNGTNLFCADATASGGTETIVATGLSASTTYYIRVYDYASGVPTTRTFTIAVTSPPPTLTVSPTSLAFSTTQAPLTQSASQSFNLSGGQLTGAPGNITVTAPSTDFQVSNDNSTWGSSTTIAYSSATLSATPVYVRFTPQSSGAKSGNVTFSGGGVTTPPTVALTGTAVLPAPVATAATNITATPSFDANWNAVTGASSGYLLDVSTSSTFGSLGPATVTESFETGLTTSYQTGNVTLSTGVWSVTNVLSGTTGVNSGTYSAQLQSATGSALVSPSFTNGISSLSFWVTSSTSAGAIQVNYSIDGGGTWLAATGSPFTGLGTTKVQRTVTLNTSVPTLIQIYRTAATIYIDDVVINTYANVPSFVTGYNAKPISGQATVTSAVNTNLVADTVYYYRLRATDGTPSAYSNVITVYPVSRGGTVSADQTICSGSQPASLNLSGHYGTILRWESSADAAFTSPTTISNTTTTLSGASIGALTTTTYFRAVVQSGTNPSANSSYVTITVNPTTVGGSVTGGASVCSGSTSGVLTLSGHTGNVVRWESSVSPFTSWTTIANTSTTYSSGALTQTTQFRAVVQSGVCAEVNSSPSTVTISTTTWDGTAWDNGTPTATTAAVINGNYSSTSNGGSITACSLTVNSGFTVVIASGDSVVLSGSLTNNGTFTLENNANLLQGGTTNSNSGAITVNRNSSALLRLDYTLWSSPVASQNLLSFSPNTLTNRFYTYNTNTNLYNAISSPSTTSFDTAKGYLIRVPNNHPSVTPTVYNGVFAGVPNNGNITFTMVDGGAGQRFNAVGNPYPSPVDAVDFVTGNSNITGTLYFWRKTNNTASPSYCTWTTGGFVSNNEAQVYDPNNVIQTGQGFFVEANGSGTSLSFDNNMRIDNHANQFFRVANTLEKHRIWLNVTNGAGLFSQTMIGYIENATNGFDVAIDGRYINDGEVALTTMIDNVDYAIQGKSLPFDATDVVPLKLTVTTAGNYTISLDHVDGLFSASQDVFLRDNQTGFVQDLKAGNYSFTSDAGTFASRFDVIYQSPLGVETPSLNNQLVVYKNEVGDFVINSGSIEMKSVKVFDLRGRLLNEYSGINATQAKVSGGSANGVLLLQITSVDGVTVTRKVVR